MPIEFKIPELGENIAGGDVVKVLVKKGDAVKVDQPVLELETDKAVVEVPSSVQGTVDQVLIKHGDKAKVGQVVFTVAGAAGAVKKSAESGTKPEPKKITAETKEKVSTQEVAKKESAPATHSSFTWEEYSSGRIIPASPAVRRLAREFGMDITQVQGSGAQGRISEEDVKNFARRVNAGTGQKLGGLRVSEAELPDFTKWGEIERKPMSAVRRKTALHLSQAWLAPHVTQHDKADITELEKLRLKFAERVEKAGGKLTPTVIVLKVAASALKVFAQFNASVDMKTEEVVYKKYCHIGVATDTDRGLLVPVVRDVDKKNIVELSAELTRLTTAARDKTLKLEDMAGGTFTITNLGGLGGTYFTPIINTPEVAILGMSRSAWEPVYAEGKFEPRLMLPLSLSYDHRLIDGADAMRFLRWVVEALQQPFLVELEG